MNELDKFIAICFAGVGVILMVWEIINYCRDRRKKRQNKDGK